MRVVILAGGLGTRLGEETSVRPKPMVEIGGKPILWHIMKYYSTFGLTEFVICLGYKGYMIKEYFLNYYVHNSDITIDVANNSHTVHNNMAEPWKITLVDTGEDSQTGGRLRRVKPYLTEDFCMTYGDGLSTIDIGALINFHKSHGKLATVSAVIPQARFGALVVEGDQVTRFEEKPQGGGDHINGGFFVLSPQVLDLIDNDKTIWEREPMETLAARGELMAFQHDGFWQPMDMLRDKLMLEELWKNNAAPWKRF
ncbi:glucose-1-phosphate cytidylyltransferase [Sphingomonas vulcanisoli]|uniref:Glucose-1-phosphate cytidylyltransferase n=1 Tax=Sphingomonas vulcanisoli TaxID=1658060 RepID=A0ABX0TWM4_9SPHN|nr:glucose-1-phosphate cytidylyltransferase [Sphingomonas vulcanisoli]NIJ09453.1 glucose-1-phosphate cytidylyltransferase [Sphingomonas vulcanisoli]